jgi:XTP/dITP diphosphohydrolase
LPAVVIVLTSPRVAPGLLTWDGWHALRSASRVGCGSLADPQAVAVAAAGVQLTEVPGDPATHWSWLTTPASSPSPGVPSPSRVEGAPAPVSSPSGVEGALAPVVWLASEDGDPGLLRLISDSLVQGSADADVEIVHASYDVPGARLIDLVRVMDRLRVDCPWDREQDHRTLVKYLIEEAYETVEAIENGDRDHLREELGDLLLQVMFHSRIAEEDAEDPWSIDDVSGDIVEKLVRRHPHVFGDVSATDPATVEANWETIKAAEKQRTSVLEGIPLALPALLFADKVLSRVPYEGSPQDLGTELLDLVRRARAEGADPEQALRDAVRAHIADASGS